MPKLGIILYGITRDQAHITAPVFHDVVIKPLLDFFEVKIFLHAFVLLECQIDWFFNKASYPITRPHDYTLYKADYSGFTNQESWSKSFNYETLIKGAPPPPPNDNYLPAKHYINSLYCLSKSFELTQQYPCDLYFISRLDLFYKNSKDIQEACLNISENISENILYTPSQIHETYGLNDKVAISNSRVAKIYCHRFFDYLKYKEIRSGPNQKLCGLNIHPESMLKRLSEYNNLINKSFNCPASRIRVDGSIVSD